MIKNYIKTAWRNLLKGKIFNGLNIVGLAVAIATSTLLLLTVYFEFSYDKFHKNGDNIYQLYFTVNRPDQVEKTGSMPVPLASAIKAEYPDIKHITRVDGGHATVTFGEKQIEQNIEFADADFFKMFSFNILEGNRNPLSQINEAVITKTAAKAIFGNQNAIGKMITLKYDDEPRNFIISAISEDFPEASSFTYDITVRFENAPDYRRDQKIWDNRSNTVFVELNNGADAKAFEGRLKPFVRKYFKTDLDNLKRDGAKPLPNGDRQSLNLTPFSQTHFNTEVSGVPGLGVSKTNVIGLLIIAVFILIIACINFINLAVARSFTRAREVGVRKTLGAGKWQLLGQFWTETVMVCLIALLIGLALASAILPAFKANFKSHITLGMLLQPVQLIAIAGVFLFITLIAGAYPAILMMRYKTVQVLKGSVNTAKPGRVRNILLVVQFSIATLLTICTLVTWQQISYLQNKPLGYNKSEVISIPIGHSMSGDQALRIFRNQLAGQPQVVGITGAYGNMGRGKDGSSYTSIIGYNYKGHEVRSHLYKVDYDYSKTLGIKMVAGRDFSRDFPSDTGSMVINEKMARQIGGGKDVVGTFLPMHDDKKPMQVIGVMKDYNFRSLREEVQPLTLVMEKDFPVNYIFIRVKPGSLLTAFDMVKEKWHQAFPDTEFMGSWVNENTEKQYQNEKRLSNTYISAAIIAIVISCIGLLAMSVMVIVQRTKEIGIRKVLGASISGIVMLLSKDFLKLVLLASVIAIPVAWWLMDKWLQGFAYRIDIHWWIFALAIAIAVVIAMATISFQAIRAAIANPVKSIKSE